MTSPLPSPAAAPRPRSKHRAGLSAGLAAACLLAAPASDARDFSKVEIEATELAPGVHVLHGAGGNIGVSSGPDGVLLIDDQFAPLSDKVRAAVAALSDGPIRWVVNTHFHGDHTGGNEALGAAGAVIVAHEGVRRRMSTEQFNAFRDAPVPPAPAAALPVVTFTEEVTFHFNGDDLRVLHVDPAHTDGDSLVHWQTANVVHMGDLFFSGGYPYIDIGSGGSLLGVIAGVDTALALADGQTKIIPGHGAVADRAGLQEYRDMLAGVRDAVRPHVEAGDTLEQTQAAKPTAAFDAKWGQGFINAGKITEFAYRSLTAK